MFSYQLAVELLADVVRYPLVPKHFPASFYSFIDIERLAVASVVLSSVGGSWASIQLSHRGLVLRSEQCCYLFSLFFSVIDVGSEWRTFSNEKSATDRSRVGQAEVNATLLY